MNYLIEDAFRVSIEDDYELVDKFLKWLIRRSDIDTFRGGSSGRGDLIHWFPSVHKAEIQRFFEEEQNGSKN